MNRFFPSVAVLMLGGSLLQADPPVASHLFPAGGQRGTDVSFHVGGLNLNQQCEMEMTGKGVTVPKLVTRTASPWFEGPVLPLPESQRQENYPRSMAARATIDAKAEPGDRLVFLRTSQGFTLPMRFVVGTLPEIVETEVDGEEPSREVKLPLTINGRIFPREDVDTWAVRLEAGQIFTAMVDSERLGLPLEAKIVLRDPAGATVAEAVNKGNRDPKLSVTAKVSGTHTITITDARGDGGPAYVYRLTLTNKPLDTSLPPSNDGPSIQRTATENPDPVRGNILPLPGVGNGSIGKPGQIDRWSVIARKNQPIDIELKARSLDSPLLGRIAVQDANGKEIVTAEAGSGEQLDPVIKWTPSTDGLFFITVADLFPRRGGADYGYRLRLSNPLPDFDLTFASPVLNIVRGANANLKLSLVRKGSFNGPVKVTIDGLPNGVTIPKEVSFAAGQNSLDVQFQSVASSTIAPAKLTITGTALIPMTPFTAMPLSISHEAVWKESHEISTLRMMVAIPTPFKIAGDYELKLIPRGTVYVRKYHIQRNGFNGPIDIELADNQARHLQGVTGPRITIPGDKSDFDYPLTLPSWMETGRTSRTCVMGTATVREADGSEHVVNFSSREQNDQIIAVVEPERLSLRVENTTARLTNNGPAVMPVTVRRGIGLAGPVEVVAEFRSEAITSAKIVVDAKLETGQIVFKSSSTVKSLTAVSVILRATTKDEQGRAVTAEQSLTVYVVP
ncbi:PPC domain-containing protein [Zavarzinella formosa]|uniref:PPC domain-containing protein n=1 Tax=Zavarzinella formosa TaxID=360055 RepID=UPI000317951E|nr:PPC domain-containing protein [Zavarzinella formosa]